MESADRANGKDHRNGATTLTRGLTNPTMGRNETGDGRTVPSDAAGRRWRRLAATSGRGRSPPPNRSAPGGSLRSSPPSQARWTSCGVVSSPIRSVSNAACSGSRRRRSTPRSRRARWRSAPPACCRRMWPWPPRSRRRRARRRRARRDRVRRHRPRWGRRCPRLPLRRCTRTRRRTGGRAGVDRSRPGTHAELNRAERQSGVSLGGESAGSSPSSRWSRNDRSTSLSAAVADGP